MPQQVLPLSIPPREDGSHRKGGGGVVRSATLAAVISLALCLSGCAAALVGGLLYDNASDNTDRAKWNQSFNANNLEREKAGLRPLDFCSEMYKAKASWAKSDSGCKDRVKRFEAGDTSALTI